MPRLSRLSSIDHVAFKAQHLEHFQHPLAHEQAQQIILEGEEKPRATRIALTAATTAKLVIDPPGFSRADLNRRTCKTAHTGPHLRPIDVGAATGHVGRDGHVAQRGFSCRGGGGAVAGLGDDLGFAGVVLGVEHFVFDAVGGVEQLGEFLGSFDAGGADQDGPAGGQIAHRLVVASSMMKGSPFGPSYSASLNWRIGFVDAGRVFAQPLLDRLERWSTCLDQQEGIVGSPLAADLVDLLDDRLDTCARVLR
jgi:hypothetical protein